ncbi:MAG: Cna B-type domain-containing protein [Clostridiales bacterium]|nr:Cna B-type domain-containing protein [Clostridiales bacterium]
MKNIIKAIAIAVLVALSAVAAPVCAEEENTLIISYEAEGAVFEIYRAGEFNEDCSFTLSGDFADYGESMNLKGLTASGWTAAAKTLYNYALTDSLSPVSSGTVSGGKAVFSGFERGLYLVSASEVTTGGYIYTSETFLVCLPNLDESSQWTDTVTVSPKFAAASADTGGGSGEEDEDELFTLLIVWIDDGNVRPEEVVYTIYRDGEVYAVVTLNEENNWQYEMTGLEVGFVWTVTQEGLPDGYTTTIESNDTDEGMEVVITNIYTGITEETSEEATTAKTSSGGGGSGSGSSYTIGGGTTETTGSDVNTEETPQSPGGADSEGTDSGETGGTDSGERGILPGSSQTEDTGRREEITETSEETEGGENLPQTGQLWLPVPILFICGFILFAVGYIRYNEERE